MDSFPAPQQQGLFSSYEASQEFLHQFSSSRALLDEEKNALCSMFPPSTDFPTLSIGGVMERVTSYEPSLSPAVVEHLWRALRNGSEPELQASTYDGGVAFGRFILGKVLYSRPKVLVIFSAKDKQNTANNTQQEGAGEEVVVKIALEEERTQLLRNEQDLLTGVLLGCEGVPQIVQAGAVALPSGSLVSHAWAIVMKPFGVSLWDIQEQRFPLMSETARRFLLLSWACRLPVILQDIHARGIVHCDIKPDNIIITPSGALTIIDFDLAIPISEAESRTTNMGTEEFGPLSIWRDGKASSEETDFISLVYTIQSLEDGVLAWLEENRVRPPFERTEPRAGSAASIALALYLQYRAKRNFLPSPVVSASVSRPVLNTFVAAPPYSIPSPESIPVALYLRRRESTSADFIPETDLLKQGRKRVREGSKDIIVLDALESPEEPVEENDLKRRHSARSPAAINHFATEVKKDSDILSELDVNHLLEKYAVDRKTIWTQWHSEATASEVLPSYDESSTSSSSTITIEDRSVPEALSSGLTMDGDQDRMAVETLYEHKSDLVEITTLPTPVSRTVEYQSTSSQPTTIESLTHFSKPVLFSFAIFGVITVSLLFTKWQRLRK